MNKRLITCAAVLVAIFAAFLAPPASAQVTGFEKSAYGAAVLAGKLLGDDWSEKKMAEMASKEVLDFYEYEYDSTSWTSPFSKIGKYMKVRAAKRYYIEKYEARVDYEKTTPNSSAVGGILNGIDKLTNFVTDIGAAFGDKRSITRKELIKASNELSQAEYDYHKAGFFARFKLIKVRIDKRNAFKKAVANYTATWGSEPKSASEVFLSREKQSQIVDLVEADAKETAKLEAKNRFRKFVGMKPIPDKAEKQIAGKVNLAKDIIGVLKDGKTPANDQGSGISAKAEEMRKIKAQLDAANVRYVECLDMGDSTGAAKVHESEIKPLTAKLEDLISM